jgi:hypothetical protein
MQLQGQGLCYGQDLGQIGELCVAEFLGYILANEVLPVLVKDVLEIFARLEDVRGQLGICAHPPGAVSILFSGSE